MERQALARHYRQPGESGRELADRDLRLEPAKVRTQEVVQPFPESKVLVCVGAVQVPRASIS